METILSRSIGSTERINFRKVFLLSGLYSSVLYIVTDIIASAGYPGYSIVDQNYSELLATGAPTRQWLLLTNVFYNILVACFAVTIHNKCHPVRLARFVGAVMLGYAIMSMITPAWFQMDMRGADPTPLGSMHPLMTAIMSLFILLSIGSGAFLGGFRFRVYSFITIFILISFGLMTSFQAPNLAAGNETPFMGLTERINIYMTMLWFAILSINLLKKT